MNSGKKQKPARHVGVKRLLKSYGADQQLEKLEKYGCSTQEMIDLLSYIATADQQDSWEKLWGFRSAKGIRAARARIEAAADEMDHILTSTVGMGMFVDEPRLLSIPDAIRLFLSDMARQSAAPRKKLSVGFAKMRLVHYVLNRTGRYHDEEVSALIGSVQQKANYSSGPHKQWRAIDFPKTFERAFSESIKRYVFYPRFARR